MDIDMSKGTPEEIKGLELSSGRDLKFDDDFYAEIDAKSKTLTLNMNRIHLLKGFLDEKGIEKIVIKKDTVLYVDSLIEGIENIITDR